MPRPLALAAFLSALWVSPSLAQDSRPRGPGPGSPPGVPAGAIELADEPFRLDNVGLTLQLPSRATVQASRVGDQQTAQIVPEDSTWLINIQTPRTSNPQATIAEAAEQSIRLIQGAFGVLDKDQTKVLSTQANLLDRQNLQLALPAERFYLSVPHGQGVRMVKGYTIFKTAPAQFVVFELITQESEFPRVRPIYETIVASAAFADPAVLAAERGTAIKAGAGLLTSRSSQDYERCLDGVERWQRLYRPAPGGAASDATELGYREIKLWKGQRAEVAFDGPAPGPQRGSQQQGYLARVRVRMLQGAGVVDSIAIYFMTPDRSEEAWAVRLTQRDLDSGRELGTWTETGARFGSDMTVMVKEPGRPARTIRPLLPSEGYLCQVETYLLPQLLIRAGAPADYGFYSYRTDTEKVSFRRDTLDHAGGGWTIRTRYRDDLEPQTAIYTENAELVRIDRGEESVWKPIEVRELFDLWRRKKLPVRELG